MTEERFFQLINGPLQHPMIEFHLTRVIMALQTVVESCPQAEQAFERHCTSKDVQAGYQMAESIALGSTFPDV